MERRDIEFMNQEPGPPYAKKNLSPVPPNRGHHSRNGEEPKTVSAEVSWRPQYSAVGKVGRQAGRLGVKYCLPILSSLLSRVYMSGAPHLYIRNEFIFSWAFLVFYYFLGHLQSFFFFFLEETSLPGRKHFVFVHSFSRR